MPRVTSFLLSILRHIGYLLHNLPPYFQCSRPGGFAPRLKLLVANSSDRRITINGQSEHSITPGLFRLPGRIRHNINNLQPGPRGARGRWASRRVLEVEIDWTDVPYQLAGCVDISGLHENAFTFSDQAGFQARACSRPRIGSPRLSQSFPSACMDPWTNAGMIDRPTGDQVPGTIHTACNAA